MSTEETLIWEEKASMRDFYVTPMHWAYTAVTLGLYAVIVYLIRLYTRYKLTSERLVKESGLLGKSIDEIELFRIKDTKLKQGFFQRVVDMGDIEIISADVSGSFTLTNIPKAREKREQIRTWSNKSREAKGVRTIINE